MQDPRLFDQGGERVVRHHRVITPAVEVGVIEKAEDGLEVVARQRPDFVQQGVDQDSAENAISAIPSAYFQSIRPRTVSAAPRSESLSTS